VKLLGKGGSLILERSDFGAVGTPADDDILLNVTVEVEGFSAADQSWVPGLSWSGFLVELRKLENDRQGKATLIAACAEDLRLEFFSTDRAGHMAVRGHVRRRTTESFELQLRFVLAFEPDDLPRVLRDLERLGSRQQA